MSSHLPSFTVSRTEQNFVVAGRRLWVILGRWIIVHDHLVDPSILNRAKLLQINSINSLWLKISITPCMELCEQQLRDLMKLAWPCYDHPQLGADCQPTRAVWFLSLLRSNPRLIGVKEISMTLQICAAGFLMIFPLNTENSVLSWSQHVYNLNRGFHGNFILRHGSHSLLSHNLIPRQEQCAYNMQVIAWGTSNANRTWATLFNTQTGRICAYAFETFS